MRRCASSSSPRVSQALGHSQGQYAGRSDPASGRRGRGGGGSGVRGAICPTPIGSYRYRKRRGSGAS